RPATPPPPARVLPVPAAVLAPLARHAPHRVKHHAKRRRPARPVRVLIPAIGVRAAIVPLHLNPDRTLQTPRNFAQAGWWAGGPRPGAPGPAVVVGHVDSHSGPAVFYNLRTLRRGDGITIVGADGRTRRFVVQRLARFPKDRFPTAEVYGPTRAPRLRLITCGGTFDASTGHYRDNTVVFARPA
ncbi:MAG TPA: class F sortase, partial [Baekduia sp.]|nr:class F sortase [Baekduia sp.]